MYAKVWKIEMFSAKAYRVRFYENFAHLFAQIRLFEGFTLLPEDGSQFLP
jgi:hypothetical protein